MPTLTKKQQEMMKLAERGGNDATLFLLDKISELEDTLLKVEQSLSELTDNLVKRNPVEEEKFVHLISKVGEGLVNIQKGEAGHTPTDEELLVLIKPLIPEVKDGHTPSKEELLEIIRPLIPKVKDGETPSDERLIGLIARLMQEMLPRKEEILTELETMFSPKIPLLPTTEEIRDNLEKLKGEERLDKKAILGLDEELQRIEKKVAPRPNYSLFGMRKVPIVKRYRLTDQCDGNTKSFTLPKDTVDVLGVFGSQFPVNFDPYNSSGGDWTFTGNTLTLATHVGAPQSGQVLWVLIETLFY